MCDFDFDDEDFEFDNEEFQTFANENKQLNDEAVVECGKKGILPMKLQEGINVGALGMTATKYVEANGLVEPLNKKIPARTLHIKNVGLIISARALRDDGREDISNKEGRMIGIRSGVAARMLFENPEVKSVLGECVDAEIARMKAASSKKKK